MAVRDRLEERRDALTPSERRVAAIVLDDPEAVAFGTVATLAKRAGTGGATVVRLAERLGYVGFTGLQDAVRDDLAGRLRLASERIRRPAAHDDLASRTMAVEIENLASTFEHVDRDALRRAIAALAVRRTRVVVLPGGASVGVARQLCDELALLRPGVTLVTGSPVAVAARTADLHHGDVVVTIDLRRYDARRTRRGGGRGRHRAQPSSPSPTASSPHLPRLRTPRSSRPQRAPARSTATSACWRSATRSSPASPPGSDTPRRNGSTASRRRGRRPAPSWIARRFDPWTVCPKP